MPIAWWVWISIGVILLLAEAITPGGFYLIFIGLAALIVGALTPAILHVAWLQILVFAFAASILIFFVRKPLTKRIKLSTPAADGEECIGETATVLEKMNPNEEGRVELRGSPWKAKNVGKEPINIKDSCRVVSRAGLTLSIISNRE